MSIHFDHYYDFSERKLKDIQSQSTKLHGYYKYHDGYIQGTLL